jgi:hypothetical protein
MSLAKALMMAASGSILDFDHPDRLVTYTMGNIVGNVLEDSGTTGRDGVITGASQVTGAPGLGNALDFVSNPVGSAQPSSYIHIASQMTLTGDFAYSAFININTTRKSRGIFLGSSDGAGVPTTHFFGYYDDSQFIRIGIQGPGGNADYNSAAVNIPDGWRHIVIQRVSGVFSLYVDKIFDQSWGSSSETFVVNSMGTHVNPSNSADPGQSVSSVHSRWIYDQTELFGRGLTQSEITELGNRGS